MSDQIAVPVPRNKFGLCRFCRGMFCENVWPGKPVFVHSTPVCEGFIKALAEAQTQHPLAEVS